MQDAAASHEVRVEEQGSVAVIEPGARAGLGDDRPATQQRRHALGVDRKLQRGGLVLVAVGALSGTQLQELVGIERDDVVLDGSRRRST